MRRSFLLAALLLILPTAFSRAEDWPAYRGPNGDGISDESGFLSEWPQAGLPLVWKTAIQDEADSTHGGPSVCGGKVFVPGKTAACDVIHCLDARTGKELWKYEYASPVKKVPYGTGIRPCPTVWKNFVYTLGCFGQLVCLETEKGTLVWQHDLLAEFQGDAPPFGMSSAPLIVDGMLICEPGGKNTSHVAFDAATGKVLWQSGSDAASYAAPQLVTLDGVRQVLTYPASGLVALDPATGRELWRFDYGDERDKNIPAPIALADRVYLSNNTLGFAAIRLKHDGAQWSVSRLWQARKEKMHYCSPIVGDGCLYFHNSKRQIKCLDLATGNINWTAAGFGVQYAAVWRLGGDRLLSISDDGEAVLLKVSPKKFQELGRFPAMGKSFVQGAVSDGCLFVRDHQNAVCFDLTGKRGAFLAENPLPKAGRSSGGKLASTAKTRANALEAWDIFGNKFIVGWLAAAALALLGVWAFQQRQVLQGVAVGQASTLAALTAMWICGLLPQDEQYHWFHTKRFTGLLSIGFGLVAALAAGWGQRRGGRDFRGKRAWGVLLLTLAATLAISRLPLATIDLNCVLFSTLVGDTRSELGDLSTTGGLVLVFSLLLFVLAWRRSENWLEDARGGRIVNMLGAIAAGVAVAFCVRSLGTVFTLGGLIAPALAARTLCRSTLHQLWLAPLLALGVVTASFAVAIHTQRPCAQFSAEMFAGLALAALAANWGLSRFRSPGLSRVNNAANAGN